jgi:hypothetical protein
MNEFEKIIVEKSLIQIIIDSVFRTISTAGKKATLAFFVLVQQFEIGNRKWRK